MALNLLGAESITSLEDDAPEAKVMKNIYYISRDSVLYETEWSFSIRLFKPAKLAQAPEWGWGSAFALPSDIMRLLRVDRNSVGIRFQDMQRNQVPHEVIGRDILCNEDVIYCSGIRRIEDEGIYSPLFDEAFAYKLAAQACMMLTESSAKLQAMAALYVEAIGKAKSRDGMQSTTRSARSHWIRNVR